MPEHECCPVVTFDLGATQVIRIPPVAPPDVVLRKPVMCRDKNHRHPQWLRNMTSEHAGKAARVAALRLGESLRSRADDAEDDLNVNNASPATGPGRWLIDSGAAVDLLRRSDVPEVYECLVTEADPPVRLITANGRITAHETIPLPVPALGGEVHPYLVKSTPAVLSLGKLCMEQGYAFHWAPHGAPVLVTPSGKSVCLQVENNCPYLDDGSETIRTACAARVSLDQDEQGAIGSSAGSEGNPSVPGTRPASSHEPPVPERSGVAERAAGQMPPPARYWPGGGIHDEAAGDDTVPTFNRKPSPGRAPDEAGEPGDGGDEAPPPAPPPPALPDDVVDRVGTAKTEARSLSHLLTHTPFNRFCETCRIAKAQKRPARKRDAKANPGPLPEEFADQLTADHIVTLDTKDKALYGERHALVIKDRATGFLMCYPAAAKNYDEARQALTHFLCPGSAVGILYSDNNGEMARAAKVLGISHDTSTPARPQNNGIVEREVRRVLEGSRSALFHSGFHPRWWAWATKYFCHAYNITNRLGRTSPWVERFGDPFTGIVRPFGSLVYAIPSTSVKKKKPLKFAPKAAPMLFMGWEFHTGMTWSGDYYVLPIDDVKNVSLERLAAHKVQRVDRIIIDDEEGVLFPVRNSYQKLTTQTGPPEKDGPTPWFSTHFDADANEGEGALLSESDSDVGVFSDVEPEEAEEEEELDLPPPSPAAPAIGNDDLGGQEGMSANAACPSEAGGVLYVAQGFDRNLDVRIPKQCPIDMWSSVWDAWSEDQKIAELSVLAAALSERKSEALTACLTVRDADGNDEDATVPSMPVGFYVPPHRNRLGESPLPFSALVARPVNRKERSATQKAQAAVQVEWDKLRKIGCWDESKVREWRDVAREAKANKTKAHVGAIFDICVEKGSELPEGDKGRKFKGRVVFQGNRVKDENWDVAMFSDLSSSPASMEAGKAADAVGLFPGNTVEQADAEQAYTQAKLSGSPTWVRLPKDQWPASWKKANMVDPVCPLVLALYGHPDSGGYWERHCEAHLLSIGFTPIEGWRSCYWHKGLGLFLTVYVDDFKMSGPKGNMKEGWRLIRKGIRTEDPSPAGKYLACDHILKELQIHAGRNPVTGFEDDVPPGYTPSVSARPDRSGKLSVQTLMYEMKGFLEQCTSRYIELAGTNMKPLRKVATPFIDESRPVADEGNPGVLGPIASRILMKILYCARMARYDLLRATCVLATCITRWTADCDLRLHRLMCYIYSTPHWCMIAWVGDDPRDLRLECFADADFAGDIKTMKSTSGAFLALVGPNSFVPLAAVSKKQGCISTSTPEAELVAANLAMRQLALPAVPLWETILQRKLKIVFREDNEAAIKIVNSGYSSALRHMARTHKVNIAWIHEVMTSGHFQLLYVKSQRQCADIFTKAFVLADGWQLACRNIATLDPATWGDPPKFVLKDKPKPVTVVTTEDLAVLAGIRACSRMIRRTLVEYCCSPESALGRSTMHTNGCIRIRLTENDDMTTEFGLKKAILSVSKNPHCHLWAAIPCTGGSTWQRINRLLPGGEARVKRHIALFNKLWHNFEIVAEACMNKGGHVSIEWPRACDYWKRRKVVHFLARNGLTSVDFDGCMLGLTDEHDTPVKKPWRVCSTSPRVCEIFNGLRCAGHGEHAQCRGKLCKSTEGYTSQMVARVHKATAQMALDAIGGEEQNK